MKYKVGDNVILNDDVEFWFKKVGGCEVPIVDTTTCSYKIKIGENQYVYIDDNSINHEATAALNFKVDKAQYGETVLNLTHAMQDFGTSMQENLNRVCNKIRCYEGGETMNANEILEKWRNKKADKLISQRNEEIKKVTKEDEIQKLVEEHETEINKIIKEKYKVDTQVSQIFCTITTRKNGDKIEAINKEFDKKVAELDEKEEEIKAVLKVAENQDKVFEILNKQGIIDKNYNIL